VVGCCGGVFGGCFFGFCAIGCMAECLFFFVGVCLVVLGVGGFVVWVCVCDLFGICCSFFFFFFFFFFCIICCELLGVCCVFAVTFWWMSCHFSVMGGWLSFGWMYVRVVVFFFFFFFFFFFWGLCFPVWDTP